MILTGRPVEAQEALSMGLANRVVPKGKALEEAIKLAEQLVGFPPICMNADRTSCYNAAYDARSFEDAMKFEFENGIGASAAEGVHGATKFKEGSGRHGKFSKL
jgi:enoyl-CoA hydratase/carnithine racemase